MYDRLGCLLRDALDSGSIREIESSLLDKHGGITLSAQNDEDSEDAAVRPCSPTKDINKTDSRAAHPSFVNTRRARTAHARSVFEALNKKEAARGSVCKGGAGAQGTARPVPYTAPSIAPITDKEKAAYAVLGLKQGAAAEEVKAAWREKLKMFHPDSNSSNEVVQKVAKQKTLEVMEAYRVLGGGG